MKKKILFTASGSNHIKAFHLPYLKWFQEQGYETHVACFRRIDLPYVDKLWEIPFKRSPFSTENFSAYRKLKATIEEGDFALISCHTPMTSVLTRLASKAARKIGTKLIYTAHGFHFFRGASLLNWLLYYPVEIGLSKMTDAIVCINQEDYNRIKAKGSKNCDYYLIPGIGADNKRFSKVNKDEKEKIRRENNIDLNDFVIVYSAEFSDRKNHQFIIEAVRDNKKHFGDDVKFLFAGKGEGEERVKALVKEYNLKSNFRFLGYRNDIDQVYKMADIGISSSKQEGLPINIIEEMLCGLPVVATTIRGHIDIVDDKSSGLLYAQGNADQFIISILSLKNDKELYDEISSNAMVRAQHFNLQNAMSKLTQIYQNYL